MVINEVKEYDDRFKAITREKDIELLRRTFEIAKEARKAGNTPFGALLADAEGNILIEQGNVELTTGDKTNHAETACARRASVTYDSDYLKTCSLYTSAEPCAMCTGAIYWCNIGRIVYAMSEGELFKTTGDNEMNQTFNHSCRKILATGQKDIVVNGPYSELVEEALAVHEGFWD